MTLRHILLALPPSLVTVALAMVACLEIGGAHPLTLGPPRNVAEAIAMRDEAAAMRLLEAGADVNDIGMIRRGVLFDRVVLASPLETAVLVDEPPTLEFLMSRGAQFSREHLACLAADIGARHVLPQLGDTERCRPGETWGTVLSRP